MGYAELGGSVTGVRCTLLGYANLNGTVDVGGLGVQSRLRACIAGTLWDRNPSWWDKNHAKTCEGVRSDWALKSAVFPRETADFASSTGPHDTLGVTGSSPVPP